MKFVIQLPRTFEIYSYLRTKLYDVPKIIKKRMSRGCEKEYSYSRQNCGERTVRVRGEFTYESIRGFH